MPASYFLLPAVYRAPRSFSRRTRVGGQSPAAPHRAAGQHRPLSHPSLTTCRKGARIDELAGHPTPRDRLSADETPKRTLVAQHRAKPIRGAQRRTRISCHPLSTQPLTNLANNSTGSCLSAQAPPRTRRRPTAAKPSLEFLAGQEIRVVESTPLGTLAQQVLAPVPDADFTSRLQDRSGFATKRRRAATPAR